MARIAPGVDLFDLQPEVRNALLTAQAELDKAGIASTVTSAARTRGAQEQLYNAYLARGKTGLPAAPPGSSKHETGQAVDFSISEQQRDAANQILAKHGFQWFGPGDRVHYTYGGPGAQNAANPYAAFQTPAAPAPRGDPYAAFTAKQPQPVKAKRAAPAPVNDYSAFQTAAPTSDYSAFQAAPAPPAYRPAVAAPGALSAPQPPQPLPGAIFAAPPSVQQKEDIQAQHNLQLPQRALNAVNTGISVGSHYLNQVSRTLGEHQAKGYNPPFDFSAFIEAARKTPWAKTFLSSITGQTAEFPELVHSFGEGAPQTSVGKFTQKHPVATSLLDLALSFPITEVMGGAQNEAVGLLGRGLSAANRATGASERILNRIPALRTLIENGRTGDAVTELINRNTAGFDRYYRDVTRTAEDARVTSQKYLSEATSRTSKPPVLRKIEIGIDPPGTELIDRGTGERALLGERYWTGDGHFVTHSDGSERLYRTNRLEERFAVAVPKAATAKAVGYKSPTTGQPVNLFEEFVNDRMNVGTKGNPYEIPQSNQRDVDRAHIALDVLRQPERLRNAAAIRQGFREGNMARSMFREQSAAAQKATDTVWSQAAREVLAEHGGATPQIPAERPLLTPAQRAAGPYREPPLPASMEAGHQSLYEAAHRQQEQEIRNLIRKAKIPAAELADLQAELSERGAQYAQRALDMGEAPGMAREVAALEQRELIRSHLAARYQAEFDALVKAEDAQRAAEAKQLADEAARTQREHIGEVIGQQKIEMSAADRARNEQAQASVKARADQARFEADVRGVEALHERVKESLLHSAYDPLAEAAQRGARESNTAAQLERLHADIRAHGFDPADVDRIAAGYQGAFDNLGQHLVNFGLLKPEAYEALKGQYLPRLYLLTKGSPGDVSEFLKFLGSEGMLTPEAIAEANKRGIAGQWGRQGMYGRSGVGPRAFPQARELTDYTERNAPDLARAMVPEATPAAIHGIEAQTRAAGLGSSMQEIAQNPEWAVAAPGGIPPPGKENWVPYPGKGPLEGHLLHPAVAEVLRAQAEPSRVRTALTALFGHEGGNRVMAFNQGMRKAMLAGPSTIANIVIGHGWFAHAEAAMAGTKFGPLEYSRALRELQNFEKTGKASQYLHEFANQTDLYARGASIIPKAAKRVSGGVGLEGRGANALRIAKKAGGKYLGLTHDMLAGGKYGLFKQLRLKGFSVNEAARMTRRATIDYTRLPAPIRVLDQGMIAPFITFTYRAVPLAGKMALRRPDIFATASGHRFTYYLDRMADRLAVSQGQQPQAEAARQSGAVGPTSFAMPGQMDEHGRQIYKQVPLLAPLLHHFSHGGTQDITQPLLQQARGALPIVTVPYQLLQNQDLRGEQPRPIVPEGLPPGSGWEAARERARWLLSAVAPPAAGLLRINDARLGVTPYAAAGKKPLGLGQAVEQFFTGNRTGTANQLMGSAEAPAGATAPGGARSIEMLQQMRAAGGEKYGQFALNYYEHLISELGRNPDYMPETRYAEKARELHDPQLRAELAAVQMRLKPVIYGEHYTGKDREAAIRRMMDWAFTLAHEAQRRGMKPPYHVIGAMLGKPLAEIRNAPP